MAEPGAPVRRATGLPEEMGGRMEILLGIGIGLGLSAACGLRVFVPLLVASLAAQTGHLALAPGFEWIGTPPALYAFATATLFEVLAYGIPWLDNLLDLIATPTAIAAGILLGASTLGGLPPWLRWSLAVIAGGGAAAATQGTSSMIRSHSSLLTGGLGNPLVATLEGAGALALAGIAILAPGLVFVLLAAMGWAVWRLGRARRKPGRPPQSAERPTHV